MQARTYEGPLKRGSNVAPSFYEMSMTLVTIFAIITSGLNLPHVTCRPLRNTLIFFSNVARLHVASILRNDYVAVSVLDPLKTRGLYSDAKSLSPEIIICISQGLKLNA